MTEYDPINTSMARKALDNLKSGSLASDTTCNLDLSSLRIHSMKQSYSLDILTRFYDEQMIPHFPLENERDELIDWIYCLDPLEISNHDEEAKQGPEMDLILCLCDTFSTGDMTESNQPLILAGVAFEYYKQAEVGLVSYVTTAKSFQKNGIMKALHPIAVDALKQLHCQCYYEQKGMLPVRRIKAILAETNTVDAGDATKVEIRNRHRALFSLGYRSVDFPYVQPPLGTEMDTFEDTILLAYQGTDETKPWFPNWYISSSIPFDFVADFAKSVFGYADEIFLDDLPFCKINQWFLQKHPTSIINRGLPWNDVIVKNRKMYDCDQENISPDVREVCVIGAGIAGLAAAIEMAKNATSPLNIRLIEASDMVGGRIKTVLTENNDVQYATQELADRYKTFAPWPVPLGAEFVHGVGSAVNDIIEENDWIVEETFDLCSKDEYPSSNSFTSRASTLSLTVNQRKTGIVKIFGQGKCWNIRNQGDSIEHYETLIAQAFKVWDKIYAIGEKFLETEESCIPPDGNLSDFVDLEMNGNSSKDVAIVKSIIDSVFAKTAGSSNACYGINEGSREELR